MAVFDSVGMWLAGLLEKDDAFVLDRVRSFARCLEQAPLPTVLVSEEVGMGLVPTTAMGRRFRDLQGEANQILAAACRNVAFCAWRPAPGAQGQAGIASGPPPQVCLVLIYPQSICTDAALSALRNSRERACQLLNLIQFSIIIRTICIL